MDARLEEQAAVDGLVLGALGAVGVGFLHQHLDDVAHGPGLHLAPHLEVGLHPRRAGHLVKFTAVLPGGREDGVQFGLGQRAGLLGVDVLAGGEATDGVAGLIGAAWRAERDDLHGRVGQQRREVRVDRGAGRRGRIGPQAGDGDQPRVRVVREEGRRELVAVGAVEADPQPAPGGRGGSGGQGDQGQGEAEGGEAAHG